MKAKAKLKRDFQLFFKSLLLSCENQWFHTPIFNSGTRIIKLRDFFVVSRSIYIQMFFRKCPVLISGQEDRQVSHHYN